MITFKAKTTTGEIINSALSPFTFPAGEAHIKKESQRDLEPTEIAILQPTPDSIHDDLFMLAMWNNRLYFGENHNGPRRVLVMPYVPGARADRGEPFGLMVYAEFINDLFIVFDPHSEATDELLGDGTNLTVVESDEMFSQRHMTAVLYGYDAIIAPDKGAVTRASLVANVAGLPVICATKIRDEETGKLSGFSIDDLDPEKNYLIVDDICDRGGTFLGLSKAADIPKNHLDLYVSHGVFSSDALQTLPESFGHIFTTNSYDPLRSLNLRNIFVPEDDYDQFRRFDVIRLLLSRIED